MYVEFLNTRIIGIRQVRSRQLYPTT